MSTHDAAPLEALVTALLRQFAADGVPVERFDTHISTVLLAGEFAYKFKKAVNFGFLDFSTLDRRHHYCTLELALNRRHAPALYVDVLPVTPGPTLGGDGPALEYVVRMRRFATDDRLDIALARGVVRTADITAIAHGLATAHAQAPGMPPLGNFGSPTLIRSQLLAGFDVLADLAPDLPALQGALAAAHAAKAAAFEDRLQRGHVRDCHGDLHLSNIVHYNGHWLPFDCIEFDDGLRYIDTASDLAFLLMDLDVREHVPYANQLLNDYLDASGDYTALAVLDYYLLYRTIVRAKVAAIEARDGSESTGTDDARRRAARHLALARRYLTPRAAPALYLAHGVSGSGKSWTAARLARARGFIHLRSDVERKRLAGLSSRAASGSELDAGLYASVHTEATYARLVTLADAVLAQGHTVVVDASFLQAAQRARFAELADRRGVHFTIIDCDAPREVLEARIRARGATGEDPSEATTAVLARQLATRQALSASERRHVIAASDVLDEQALRQLPGGDRVPSP